MYIQSVMPSNYLIFCHPLLLLSSIFTSTRVFFILSGIISPHFSSSILGTYWPGEFIFQCHIFLPFHTVHGVLKARILKWFAVPFSSGPHFVRTLHYDPSILGGPTSVAHSFNELDKAVVHVISLISFCDCGFNHRYCAFTSIDFITISPLLFCCV